MQSVLPYRRWVLITGCDSGFGCLAARQLLERGFGVIALCLTEQGCQDVSRGIEPHAQLRSIQCDISKPDDLKRLQAELQYFEDGKLWAVVNNAGIVIPGYVDFLDVDDFRRVMEVNFFAPVSITKFCLPLLKQSRGRVINISSSCGLVALAANAPYNCSKFALRAFNDTLRRELSVWGISVSLIIPGMMKTPLIEKFVETLEQKFQQAAPDVRQAYGEEFWQSIVTYAKKMSRMAGNPQQVVEAIIHAVESRRPKSMYILGVDGKLFYQLHRSPPGFADMFLNASGKAKPAALEDRGSRQIEFTALYSADSRTVWKYFIEELWLKGAGLTPGLIVEEVGDETGNGATRWVPVIGKYGIREKITFTRYPEYFCYQVLDPSSSIFPVLYHRGRVDFIPWAEGKTRLVWSVEYTPIKGALPIVNMVFRYTIPKYLKALEHACNASAVSATPPVG